MAKTDHGKQYCFRINLDNPDHLRIYRTLEDLNVNIHKSVSNFVVKALLAYIKETDESELTNSGKDKRDNLDEVLTRRDIEDIEKRILINVLKEVAQMFGNASTTNQSAMMNQMLQMIQNQQESGNKVSHTQEKEETTDAALEEMSLLFSQSDYGEE